MMDRVRTQERLIMKLCVERAKCRRKTSLPCLPATKPAILVQRGNCDEQAVVGKTARCLEEVHRALQKLQQIEEETGLTSSRLKISTVVCPSVKRKPACEERDG